VRKPGGVLFDGERAGIELRAKDAKVGHPGSPRTAKRKAEKLCDKARDRHAWVTEEEELVQAWDQDREGDSDNPSADCGRRHVRVIGVANGCADL